jgi:hypothetical protein
VRREDDQRTAAAAAAAALSVEHSRDVTPVQVDTDAVMTCSA